MLFQVDDYKRIAPAGSFIHVDDFHSPRDLAAYLRRLDANDTEYLRYFDWRLRYTFNASDGQHFNIGPFCQICRYLHEPEEWERAKANLGRKRVVGEDIEKYITNGCRKPAW